MPKQANLSRKTQCVHKRRRLTFPLNLLQRRVHILTLSEGLDCLALRSEGLLPVLEEKNLNLLLAVVNGIGGHHILDDKRIDVRRPIRRKHLLEECLDDIHLPIEELYLVSRLVLHLEMTVDEELLAGFSRHRA